MKTTKRIVTIKNNFHGTEARVKSEVFWAEDINSKSVLRVILSDTQANRVGRKLCGMKDCTCGGIRGPQELDGRKLQIGVDQGHGVNFN